MSDDMSQSDHDLLVRIDERTKKWENAMPDFVTRKEFDPVRAIAFGLMALMAFGVVGALLTLVIKK